MRHWSTKFGIVFSLLAVVAVSGSDRAWAQEQRLQPISERTAEASGGTTSESGKADSTVEPIANPDERENSVGVHLIRNIAEDQKALWIAPKSIRFSDADWFVPLGGATAAMLATDTEYSKHLSNSPNRIKYSKDLSNYGLASLVGIGGGLYVLGHVTHDDHKIETGILAGEAAIDSLVPVYGMKYAFGRERPLDDNYRGRFGQGGVSFPSEHAAAAWSIASVVAHEYPGPLTSLFAYGLASAVSASRITGKQHFPSDVLIGSAIGWLEGMYVYRKHHDPKIGGGEWETYVEAHEANSEGNAHNLGSPYVELDSWVYPALEQLVAQGYVSDAFLGMRPWTRLECARLLDEAQDRVHDTPATPETQKLIDALTSEFAPDLETIGGGSNRQVRVESVYARITGISGTPLTDGNHFGQTLANDFGRPYQSGFNSVDGFSAWTTSGRWTAYIRAEYQHAASGPALPAGARELIFSQDHLPSLPMATPVPAVNRLQMLDGYVAATWENWQVSFGRQSLWWSPMQSGPLMFSDNAQPINMFRISRASPFKLPSILGWLGPMRIEGFVGQLTGHEFVSDNQAGLVGLLGQPLARQPLLHGEKLSFKPTSNFEFSVNETTVFAGGPTPLTWHTFINSYRGFTVPVVNTAQNIDITDPRSGVDFNYRVPKLRRWLTFYGDAFTEDEFSPLGYPRKSAIQGGVYLPQIPGIPKLDLRLEGGTTAPVDFPGCGGCFYVNDRYPDGSYVNKGNLIGSWLGRGGQGEQAWSTYRFSPRNSIQFHYRHQKIDAGYLPGGGTLNDGGIALDVQLRPTVSFSGSIQYEKWNLSILAPGPQSNVTASLQLTYWPRLLK